MNKRSIIILCTVITIIIFFVFIYYIFKNYREENIPKNMLISNTKELEMQNNNVITTGNYEEETVAPNAKLIMKQLYKQCGHIVQEECIAPESVVNMKKADVEKYYSDWQVEEFSTKNLQIYKENNGICNEHYIVKSNNGYIEIYSKGNNGEERLFSTTEILTKYLPKEDQNELKNGVNIVGKSNLSSFLEDFE